MDISLDREITVEQKSETTDATYGTKVVVWIPLVALPGSPVIGERFWAEVRDALPSRSEGVAQDMRVSRKATRIRLRYRNDITSDMRVIVHGDTDELYQIVSPMAEIGGRKAFIEFMAEKFTSDPPA